MVSSYSYNILKAWMQKDSDKPLGAEKHLLAGAIAGTFNTTLAPQLVQNLAARVLTDTKKFNHVSCSLGIRVALHQRSAISP